MIIRYLIVAHRWLGVALCALFLLWFPSGIGMMYWGMPAITVRDRLERAPRLDPAKVVLSPDEAGEKLAVRAFAAQVRLNSFDGRPVYRFGGPAEERIVYADTGEEQGTATIDMRNRAAASWTGQSIENAVLESVTEPDQWIVGNRLRNLRPLWKYSWPDGEHVYIGESGDVLLYTTWSSRLAAYASAIPHWVYFTPLRKYQPVWIRFTTYAAVIGTVGAIIGVALGLWLYSPKRKYRFAGAPSSIPFRGTKRWHTILGSIFGVATITWTFSGSLAFLPFPPTSPPRNLAQREAPPSRPPQGQRGRQIGADSLANALRGRVQIEDFAAMHPREVLEKYSSLDVKEIEFTSFAGKPYFRLHLGDGRAKTVALDGRLVEEFDRQEIADIVRETAREPQAVETRILNQYDLYYLDRTHQLPLPVILAHMHDEENTRYYIDPKTASVVRSYSNRIWWRRWLYNGLHSLNFPWLYRYRPLWDIIVIGFMLGGTVLCPTAIVLAWRAVDRKLRGLLHPHTAKANVI